MTCQTCQHATEHGHWGQPGTHCDTCHRSWTSTAQSHCTICCRHFGSDSAGDAHRAKNTCRDPKGYDQWDTPNGPIFGGIDPELGKARGAALTAARMTGSPVAPDE